MLLTHTKPYCPAARPVVAPAASIAATLAAMQILHAGSLAAAFAAIRAEQRK